MAAVPVSIREDTAASGCTSSRLKSAGRCAVRLLDAQLQRVVERAATLADAQAASLAVLDPTSQVPVLAAACSRSLSGPRPANLRVHAEIACWVSRHRTPAIVTDFAHDPHARELGLFAVGSLLSVPLLSEEQVLGALTISSPLINAFKPYHLRLLEALADLGALAIMLARKYDAEVQRTEQLTLLLDASRALGTVPDMHSVIGLAVSAMRKLISCEEAVIYVYDARTETLCGVAGLGTHSRRLAEARIRLRDPQSVTAWVAQQRQPLLHSSQTNGFVGPATEALLAERELALLAVPLIARERLWGVITLARTAPFQTGELRTMLTLSQIVAPALAQTRSDG